uniref:Uncharacterized protein n=1 Tax=Timspurckia oligopyrenoides TaxID=708627 RepID=A0A7S0ZB89_9RHOD|mmetsp:Transcript_11003/g.19884  ORF Transcript_11003/g.19884 Transcript_11003/m.19884 type:complete len:421 (+) Transcript_11003:179-1441(+)
MGWSIVECGKDEKELMYWAATQQHILTGGGLLTSCAWKFNERELPHYYLGKSISHRMFNEWNSKLRDSDSQKILIGAWERTLFKGGQFISNTNDTQVFNLQTSLLFIDMRFPNYRFLNSTEIKNVRCLDDLTNHQLRLLARQHCFSGVSLIQNSNSTLKTGICTRHHCIDWNYHPQYPRNRPNQWKFIQSPDALQFDEYSVAFLPLKPHQLHENAEPVPVYMESWRRYSNDSNGRNVFAMRLIPESDPEYEIYKMQSQFQAQQSDPMSKELIDAVFLVIGNHFAYVEDNRGALISDLSNKIRGSVGSGCANLVDAAYRNDDRDLMKKLLSVEGSYGQVKGSNTNSCWTVLRSTMPWKEASRMLMEKELSILCDLNLVKFKNRLWKVYENSFTKTQLENELEFRIVSDFDGVNVAHQRAKL